jgi:N-acetyl-anhydromuramyl-L-alanine amidase AmpD
MTKIPPKKETQVTRKKSSGKTSSGSIKPVTHQSIVACGQKAEIGAPVVLWDQKGGYVCPNKRGRSALGQHDPALNDRPTRPDSQYQIFDPDLAGAELKKNVYQFILHYDVCYSSHHCHEILQKDPVKGSHFYLDLDGTIYQTCDLYWKTNTAPADDRVGNERSVHVEIANLASEALKSDSELYKVDRDQYRKRGERWLLTLPERYQKKIRTPGFKPYSARACGKRGYFTGKVNGKVVRMWDFTEEQYQSLIRLCIGIHQLLPRIELRVPYDEKSRRTPMDRIDDFATFAGILGHAHVQSGESEGVTQKHDPGPAFQWNRLRRAFRLHEKKKTSG